MPSIRKWPGKCGLDHGRAIVQRSAAGQRVFVGRAVPLPIVANDQSKAPGGTAAACSSSDLEDINASL